MYIFIYSPQRLGYISFAVVAFRRFPAGNCQRANLNLATGLRLFIRENANKVNNGRV